MKVHVSGFTVTQEEIPSAKSAQNVDDYAGVRATDLAFYEGTTEVYKTTQLRSDPTTSTKAIPNTRQMLDIISSVIFYTPIDGSLKQILTP